MKKDHPSKKVEPEYVAIGFQGEDGTEEVLAGRGLLVVDVAFREEVFPLDTMMPPPPLETQYTFCVGGEPGCERRTLPKVMRRSRAKVELCLMATLCARDKKELWAAVSDGKKMAVEESVRARNTEMCIVSTARLDEQYGERCLIELTCGTLAQGRKGRGRSTQKVNEVENQKRSDCGS